MIKVGIVGYGYVGKAMFKYFKNHYDTIYYDPYVEGSCTKDDINDCHLAVVCIFSSVKRKLRM